MTIDDENSIYVGGLPYECTESQLRRSFELYGSIVSVKIVNDRVAVGGKCFGFVTFKNPRSVIEAISEMDGQTIGGRVVRVNEVTSRGAGGRPNYGRENVRRNQRDWEMNRGRERENDFDKDRQRDRSHEVDGERERRRKYSRDRNPSHDRDRNPSHDRGRNPSHDRGRNPSHDRGRNPSHDRDRNPSHDRDRNPSHDRDHSRGHFQRRDHGQSRDLGEWQWEQGRTHSRNADRGGERDDDFNATQDRELDRVDDHDRSVEKNDLHSKRKNSSNSFDQQSVELSSGSSDYRYQGEGKLDSLTKRRDKLQKEKSDMEQRLEDKKQLAADLKKRCVKLEDLLTSAKKESTVHQMQLTKLCKCFQQVKEYGERLKSSEEELQDLVKSVSKEVEAGDDLGAKEEYRTNGKP